MIQSWRVALASGSILIAAHMVVICSGISSRTRKILASCVGVLTMLPSVCSLCRISWPKSLLTLDCVDPNVDFTDYGIHPRANETSIFYNQTIPAPPLDIELTYWARGLRASSMLRNSESEKRMVWVAANETYNYDMIMERGTCQPVEVSFSTLHQIKLSTFPADNQTRLIVGASLTYSSF